MKASFTNGKIRLYWGLRVSFAVIFLLTSCGTPLSVRTPADQSSNIPDQEMDNLIAFTQLIGYVQYFHPSDQAYDTNWEKFTKENLGVVMHATDRDDLVTKLNEIFLPIAPTVAIFDTSQNPVNSVSDMAASTASEAEWTVAWRHHGYGGGVKQGIYYSERVYEKVEAGVRSSFMPDPYQPLQVELEGGVSAQVPVTLFVDYEGNTIPYSVVRHDSLDSIQTYTSDEKIEYVATVMLSWNVFQHFYPYFDVVQIDWLSALRDALTGALVADNDEEFFVTLQEMVAQLHDGHGKVWLETDEAIITGRPPFGWDWVEDSLVITFVEEAASGELHAGDVVIEINGHPTATVLENQECLISGATPQWIKFRAIQNILEGPYDSDISLTIQQPSGYSREFTFKRTVQLSHSEALLFTELRPNPIGEIKPGIWYVDLSRITEYEFDREITALSQADGIVFDLRGYPYGISLDPVSHIIEDTVTWPQLNIPIIMYPDFQKATWDSIVQSVQPASPFFDAKIAFIADGRAISYAESYLGIIESNAIADIVGEPTAGTNGNIAVFTLFGQYTFQFTGMQVLKLGGSQHHGVGILPTVPVSRTLDGIREGHDELLEKAIESVSQP